MAGARNTSLPGIIQQIESTRRKRRTRRAHLEQNRSRGRTKEVARLGEATARAPARGDRTLEHHSDCKKDEMVAVGLGMRLI
jgi:hypothetical protein